MTNGLSPLPLFFHPDYAPTLPPGHRFSMSKYALLPGALDALGQAVERFDPPLMPAEWLNAVHDPAYVAAVPTYVGGFMTLGWSSKAAGLRAISATDIRARAEKAGILGLTRYWSPEIHASCFHLPPYIAENLDQA